MAQRLIDEAGGGERFPRQALGQPQQRGDPDGERATDPHRIIAARPRQQHERRGQQRHDEQLDQLDAEVEAQYRLRLRPGIEREMADDRREGETSPKPAATRASRPAKSGRQPWIAVIRIDSAIPISTGWADSCQSNSAPPIRVSEWPMVKAVTIMASERTACRAPA